MGYPKLEINLSKIYHNGKVLMEMCGQKGIEVAAVTKVFRGYPEIAEVLVKAGVTMLADSRIENIKKLKDIEITKMLIRIPMMSEIEELVEHVDISINSELEVIDRISQEALRRNKVHQIMLMIDLGDLREGLWEDEVDAAVRQVLMMKGVQLVGLGANFGCYGGIVPERHTLEKLIRIKNELEEKHAISISYLSGGNSNSLHLIWEGQMPEGINHLRIGYPFVLGKEDVYDQVIDGLYDDAFRLYGEIVEIKNKPSVPIGKRGIDAFGNRPEFVDHGMRKRAIVAIGRQDVRLEGITSADEKVSILGASSDHLILDISDCDRNYHIGDIMEFRLNYGALLAAMTSDYVEKEIIE